MDMFTLLKDQHRKMLGELEQVLSQKPNLDMDMVKQICTELVIHTDMEEKYLYPVMEAKPETREMTKEAIVEHQEMQKLLDDIRKDNISQEALVAKVGLLQADLQHHVREEENDLFPQCRKLLSQDQIDQMSREMTQFNQQQSQKMQQQPIR